MIYFMQPNIGTEDQDSAKLLMDTAQILQSGASHACSNGIRMTLQAGGESACAGDSIAGSFL